jgi:hypothetical protein
MSPAAVPEQFRGHTYITADHHGFAYVVMPEHGLVALLEQPHQRDCGTLQVMGVTALRPVSMVHWAG